ncbi:MarR family transcriptional regulator [Tepidibacillus marianensis]|uniref:MarR family winged helix-turn-helix transcriptional regulator n=1 Tax=Tepidibacillus marianensis TaxID=3131995 RepID=UPI0030CE16AC
MEELNKGIMIVRLLKQLMDGVRQTVQQEFKQSNLTGPQGMLVGTLAHHGAMKISDLSERVGLSNSTISGIVDRLQKQGYVERIRSEEDRRVVYVNVTDEFRKDAKKHFNEIENKFGTIMDQTTPEEFDKIFEGLNLLKELMERHQQKKE